VRVSAADWQTSLQLRRMRALLWGRVLDAKLQALDRAIKAFDPNQPRVPAGNPDGGQWTSGGGGGGGSDATSDVRVAQARRRGRGSDAEGTPVQQFVRNVRESEAREAIRRVQEIDPGWRPSESLERPNSIEGQIARAEGRRDEANARRRELGRQDPRDVIDAFRRGHIPDLFGKPTWSADRHTVALCKVDDLPFIGVNSKATQDYTLRDVTEAMRLRTTMIEKYPDVMSTDNIGQIPNDSLFHAEVTCLLRAAHANGDTLEGRFTPAAKRYCPQLGLNLAILP
jgi:hypothetical protein